MANTTLDTRFDSTTTCNTSSNIELLLNKFSVTTDDNSFTIETLNLFNKRSCST